MITSKNYSGPKLNWTCFKDSLVGSTIVLFEQLQHGRKTGLVLKSDTPWMPTVNILWDFMAIDLFLFLPVPCPYVSLCSDTSNTHNAQMRL